MTTRIERLEILKSNCWIYCKDFSPMDPGKLYWKASLDGSIVGLFAWRLPDSFVIWTLLADLDPGEEFVFRRAFLKDGAITFPGFPRIDGHEWGTVWTEKEPT